MDIVILGSGNAASVLGRKFKAAGHQILQVWGRHSNKASELAYEWDTESTNYISLINRDADVYIIAVSDNAIAEVAAQIQLPEKVVAHTAASMPSGILSGVTSHYGVFYPLQSLRKENPQLPEIPIFYDGNDSIAVNILESLAMSISSTPPVQAGDADREKLHVAAVLSNNFVNHLYALAAFYCRSEGIDFRQLHPLILETAQRILVMEPQLAQTGPAIRHDRDTLRRHLELLSEYPMLKNVYLTISESIQA